MPHRAPPRLPRKLTFRKNIKLRIAIIARFFILFFFCRQQAFSASCLQVQNSDDENQPENTEGTFSKYRIAYYFPLIGLFFSQVSKAFTGRNSAKAYEDLSPLVLNFSAAQFFPKTTCDSHLKRKGNSIYT